MILRTRGSIVLVSFCLVACSDDGEPANDDEVADEFGQDATASAGGSGDDDGGTGPGDAGSNGEASEGASEGADGDVTDSGVDSTGGPPGGASLAELCALPGVIFCEDFEGGWDGAWLEDGGDVRIVPGAAVEGEGSEVVELATYDGQQSSKLIYAFPDTDEIYIRFDVQYDAAYDNTGGSHGPILGGSTEPPWGLLDTAGIKPDGDDHFVLNFEPMGTVGAGGTLGFYAYFVNMMPDGNGDYWGNLFESSMQPPPTIVAGTWHCAEYGLTLNTPGETTDGTADFWFDGVHHGEFGGFQWRTIDTLRINTFVLDSYNHFNDGPLPPRSPNLVRYDNVVISTSPVGCL